jgi:hypothetical protein
MSCKNIKGATVTVSKAEKIAKATNGALAALRSMPDTRAKGAAGADELKRQDATVKR